MILNDPVDLVHNIYDCNIILVNFFNNNNNDVIHSFNVIIFVVVVMFMFGCVCLFVCGFGITM